MFDNTANGADEVAFANLLSEGCCLTSLVASCPWDLNNDLVTDISDLSILLSNFGTTSGATREDGDVEGGSGCGGTDGDVDLLDLSCLLANFGAVCCPEEEEPPTGDLTISIDAYDTSAYSGGGFEGEDEHFVFDVLIEVEEEDDD